MSDSHPLAESRDLDPDPSAQDVGSKKVEKVLRMFPEISAQNLRENLVSHFSAIGDTISCDAPYSAIGFRGKFLLRNPPLVRPVFELR